jgi:hypothetical protein
LHIDTIQTLEVQILAAGGGGVLVDRYACELNGDPVNPTDGIFPIEGALEAHIPDYDDQIYVLQVRAPSIRCRGNASMQLIFANNNGDKYFQCQDLTITYSGEPEDSGRSKVIL